MRKRMDEKILQHIIEMKEGQGKLFTKVENIEKHLSTLNGSVAENTRKIGRTNITLAKWGGGLAMAIILLEMFFRLT